MENAKKFLSEVNERREKATGGPWKTSEISKDGWGNHRLVNGYQRAVKFRDFIKMDDAEFIAHSRKDVDVLCAMMKKLLWLVEEKVTEEKELEWLRDQLDRCIQGTAT